MPTKEGKKRTDRRNQVRGRCSMTPVCQCLLLPVTPGFAIHAPVMWHPCQQADLPSTAPRHKWIVYKCDIILDFACFQHDASAWDCADNCAIVPMVQVELDLDG